MANPSIKALTWLSRHKPSAPLVAICGAIMLFCAGLAVASFNEVAFRAQAIRESKVQAQMLAASVTAALAFEDAGAAQEYVESLHVNPQIETGGVYDAHGRLVASYTRPGAEPPARRAPPTLSRDDGRTIEVSVPVTLKAETIGSVFLKSSAEPFFRTANRYAAIGILGLMAALMVGALAAANAGQRRAYAALEEEVEQRERAEEALRQSQKMEAVGQLTGGVAHDFNNLLMVASSGLYLLDRTEDPQKREYLKQGVRQAIERGASLTRQLLAFSRRAPLTSQVVDLRAQIESMRLLLDRSLREDIDVRMEVDERLWPVEIDPGALEVAVVNIALNARDAMPTGGTITIRLTNRPGMSDGELQGDMVELAVSDTGQGMEPELASRIFEPFFTTKEVGRGTGLGLAQVYGFARASRGGVRVRSKPGEGATLSLFFPRSHSPVAAAPNDTPPAPEEAGARPLKILLVEDDDAVAAAVSEMLTCLGHDSRRVVNADAAMAMLDAGPPVDVVLSDMVMPGNLDGIGLAREIRRQYPGLPVLLTTGYSEAAEQAIGEGLIPLAKPYTAENLATRLESVTRSGSRPSA
ncbi:MAG TPA: ATP-binding protein [Caulobacteraceae bacterium]|nr:ATP-binding protein [Caulobacteraceae bacterium]